MAIHYQWKRGEEKWVTSPSEARVGHSQLLGLGTLREPGLCGTRGAWSGLPQLLQFSDAPKNSKEQWRNRNNPPHPTPSLSSKWLKALETFWQGCGHEICWVRPQPQEQQIFEFLTLNWSFSREIDEINREQNVLVLASDVFLKK